MARRAGHDDTLAEVARLAAAVQKCMLKLDQKNRGEEGKPRGGAQPRLGKQGARNYEARPGDWECEVCGFARNFASRQACYDCGTRQAANRRGSSPRGAGNSRPLLGRSAARGTGSPAEGKKGGQLVKDGSKAVQPSKPSELPTPQKNQPKDGFLVVDKSKGIRPKVGEHKQGKEEKEDVDMDVHDLDGTEDEGTEGEGAHEAVDGEEDDESHEDYVNRLKAQWDKAEQAVVLLRRQGWEEGECVYDTAREGAKVAEEAWRAARGPIPFQRRYRKARDAVNRHEHNLGKARAELEQFQKEARLRASELEDKVLRLEDKFTEAKAELAVLHREEAEQEGWTDHGYQGKAREAVSDAYGKLQWIGEEIHAALEDLEDSSAKQRICGVGSVLQTVAGLLEANKGKDGPEQYLIDSEAEDMSWEEDPKHFGYYSEKEWTEWYNGGRLHQETSTVAPAQAAQGEEARSAQRSKEREARGEEERSLEDCDL